MLWECSRNALKMLWKCSEDALGMLWNALTMLWECSGQIELKALGSEANLGVFVSLKSL